MTKSFSGTKCNIAINTFDFNDAYEKSDWTENAIASFSAEIWVEESCTEL